MTSIKIKPASRDDARKLLRLTLATPGQSAAERENHVTRFIEYARQLSLDLSRQWVSMALATLLRTAESLVILASIARL